MRNIKWLLIVHFLGSSKDIWSIHSCILIFSVLFSVIFVNCILYQLYFCGSHTFKLCVNNALSLSLLQEYCTSGKHSLNLFFNICNKICIPVSIMSIQVFTISDPIKVTNFWYFPPNIRVLGLLFIFYAIWIFGDTKQGKWSPISQQDRRRPNIGPKRPAN